MSTVNNVWISGMGIVSSIGENIPNFCNSLKEGKSGIKELTAPKEPKISVNIGAEISNFSFKDSLNQFQELPEEKKQVARRLGQRAPFTIQTSIISALEAWLDSNLFSSNKKPERIGLVVAGQNSTQNYQYNLISKFKENPEYLSPRYALEFLDTNQVGVLSELFNIKGEGLVIGGASASGNVALIKASQMILSGAVDVCLVCGVVADFSPIDMQGFVNIGAMGGKAFNTQPELACRPFDAKHEGFIYGQASACVVLESESSAKNRGASLKAELKGSSINLDANSSANPNLDGEIKAMRNAIEQSGMALTDIDYINTHGSSSPLGDKTEAEAIEKVFEKHTSSINVNATKGLTGHCLYSAGIVEAIATVLQMQEGFLHPNINLNNPINNELNFCGAETMFQKTNVALSNSFGFGGINSSILLKVGKN